LTTDEQDTSDHRGWVRAALTQAGIAPNPATVDDLMDRIARSVDIFRAETATRVPLRASHNALRALFMLLEEEDPSPALIRKRFGELPPPAARWVARRAKLVWPRLTKKKETSDDAFGSWLATAPRDDLIRILRALVTEGGVPVQRRSDDRPAKCRFEPMIMGTSLGGKEAKRRGGRPPEEENDDLVMNLALDWLHATGQKPVLKRSESNGFPGLVHRVFDHFKIKGAEPALRRYVGAVRRASQAIPGKRPKS
jgi:hypothetical protein